LHQSDQSGVVDLNTNDSKGNHQVSPDRKSSGRVRQDGNDSFQNPKAVIGLGNRKPQAAARGSRPGANVPELGHVLGCHHEYITANLDGTHCAANRRVQRIVSVNQAQQNAGIEEDNH
jgi:hypothetical protein